MRSRLLNAAALGGAAVLGAAAGTAVERAVMGRSFRANDDEGEPWGKLRGPASQVQADDGTLLYVEIDEPDDPLNADVTIVFNHGYSLNLDTWHCQRRDLRNHARLVFWDQRSHGRSSRGTRDSHTIDQLGRDLGRVIAECAPNGPLMLVGHSMGGMTIMSLAADDPDLFGTRVAAVALLATSAGHLSDLTLRLPAPAAHFVQQHTGQLASAMAARSADLERGRARTTDLNFLLTKRYSFGSDHVSRSHAQFVADLLNSTPMDVLAEYLPEFGRHDKAEALAALQRVQTLVMVGDRDVLTPDSHSREIVRQVPGADLVIVPSTGHMIISEQYRLVNSRLLELLAVVRGS